MLDRLRDRDPDGRVTLVLGDMVDDLPDGPFDVVLVAYNSLFNLESADAPAACFAAVAARLAPGGVFVVEAFVPEDPPRAGSVVAVRSMTDTRSCCRSPSTTPASSAPTATSCSSPTASGCACGRGRSATPRRPSSTRWRRQRACDWPARWEDFDRHPFGDASPRHVSVYSPGQRAMKTLTHGVRGSILEGTVSQMRLNPLTGRWVTIVAERARRPTDFAPRDRQVEAEPDRPCPFCPGNEDATLPALETVDDGGSWRIRVVPNLYPAFDGDDRLRRPPPRPGARHRRGQRHPRGVRLHARPRRRLRPARRRRGGRADARAAAPARRPRRRRPRCATPR